MDMNIVSKSVILWLEHFALITGGFIAGAFAFYFRSKHYLKTRLFTKDEVKEIVDMALGEELRNVKRSNNEVQCLQYNKDSTCADSNSISAMG